PVTHPSPTATRTGRRCAAAGLVPVSHRHPNRSPLRGGGPCARLPPPPEPVAAGPAPSPPPPGPSPTSHRRAELHRTGYRRGVSQPMIAAHRGANEFLPEHSLAAYRQAIVEGADAFEFDIRLTADGHLVLHHDRTVKRTSDGKGAVSELTLEQLRELNFAALHPDCGDDPEAARIPTIEDLFGLVADS